MLDHVFDLIGVEHGEHDRIAVAGDVGERCGAAADLPKALVLGRIDVEAGHRKSRRHEPARIDFAHEAKADNADGDLWRHWSCGSFLSVTREARAKSSTTTEQNDLRAFRPHLLRSGPPLRAPQDDG